MITVDADPAAAGTGIMTLVVSCDVPRYGKKLNYKQQLLDYDIDVEPGAETFIRVF